MVSLALISFLLTSCVIDDDGNLTVTSNSFDISGVGWLWLIIGVFIIIFFFAVRAANKDHKDTTEVLSERKQDLSDFKIIGNYVGGHPDYDKEIMGVSVRQDNDDLCFYEQRYPTAMPYHRFDIKKDSVKSIDIEDASTIENKITVGRIFLVGLFALGWRKKKKNELAFVVINWNDGRFDHSTTFVCEGKNAMQKANAARNHLIKSVR